MRVPFIARWPGKLPAGKTTEGVASTLDLFPTFLAWSRAASPGVSLDGRALTSLLEGGSSPRTGHFWEWRGAKAARRGNWKWVEPGGLFDLSQDPGERTDLSAAQPEVARRLQADWRTWKKEMDAAEPRGPFLDY